MSKNLDKIIEGCKKDERVAREKLYQMYADRMFGICLRYTKDHSAAEDILQEGFIKIFKNIKQYKYTGSFEGWLRRIMINTAIEKFRKKNSLHYAAEISLGYDIMSSEDIMAGVSAKELLKLIQSLSAQYRVVFNLYVFEGFSHQEISEKLNISEGTSKSNLARARKILQEKVIKYFGISDAGKIIAK